MKVTKEEFVDYAEYDLDKALYRTDWTIETRLEYAQSAVVNLAMALLLNEHEVSDSD